jgi:hypothetical protein
LVLAFATIVAGIALGDGAAKPARAPMVTGALYGRAMRDSVAVANTNVVVLGTRCTTVTDANGWFRINAVPVGRWVLRAVGERCAGDIANVTVDAGSVDTVVVSLDCPEIDCDFPGKRGLPAGCLLRDAQARRRAGTFCHAHPRERLAVDTVQVSYGLLLHQPGFDQAERDSFPDAHTFADGGCVTGQTAYQEVVYCAACRRARDNWQRAHPRPHH